MKWKRLWYWILIPLSALLALSLFWHMWPQPRAVLYRLYREQGRERTLDGLTGYEKRSSERFDLYFTSSDEGLVDLVLETAEAVYGDVIAQVGFYPEGKVPIILYSTRQELRKAFGWGSDQSAVGVYWQGSIRLLSPHVWIDADGEEGEQEVFGRINPITHELTHYVLDVMTDGNYPRWFTEGLAQRVERQVIGYLWIEPSAGLDQPLYNLADLQDRFDALPNQPLVYRQSYLLVEYMFETYGGDGLSRLIQLLAAGQSFPGAVERALGTPLDNIYANWLEWVNENQERLDQV